MSKARERRLPTRRDAFVSEMYPRRANVETRVGRWLGQIRVERRKLKGWTRAAQNASKRIAKEPAGESSSFGPSGRCVGRERERY